MKATELRIKNLVEVFCKIKYFHQLQNFHFAHIGKELACR